MVRLATGSNQVNQSNNGKINKKLDQLKEKYVTDRRESQSRNVYQGQGELKTLDIRNPTKPISNAMKKKIYLTNDGSQLVGTNTNSPANSSAVINQ